MIDADLEWAGSFTWGCKRGPDGKMRPLTKEEKLKWLHNSKVGPEDRVRLEKEILADHERSENDERTT